MDKLIAAFCMKSKLCNIPSLPWRWFQNKMVVLVSAVVLLFHLPQRAEGVVCDGHGFFGDPDSCTRFWVCSPDGATSFDCNPGLIWNEGAKRCDWPYNTVCDKEDTGKTTVKSTSSATTTETTTPSPSTSSSTESTTSSSTSTTTTSSTTVTTTPPPTTTETTTETTVSPTTSSSSSSTSTSSSTSSSTTSSSSSSSSSSSRATRPSSRATFPPRRTTPPRGSSRPHQCKNRMDGFYPNWMKQCTEYFLCMSGEMTNHRKCSYGLVFDVFTAKCQRKEKTKPPCGTYAGASMEKNGAFSFYSAPNWLLISSILPVTSLGIFKNF